MAPAATALRTGRLLLVPLVAADADEMAVVLANEEMHHFTGGHPLAATELRERYHHLAVGHSADGSERWCNWIVRLASDGQAVGTLQATITDGGGSAVVAWEIGVPWQQRGFASEAATAVVGWLIDVGIVSVSAHVHADHVASARVAAHVGLAPTPDTVDGEVVWRRPTGGG